MLLKQAAAFRTRPDDFASLLAQRGGIGRKDFDAFEELHARARRHRRAATMRHVHQIKREVEQQGIEPEMRQGVSPLGGRASRYSGQRVRQGIFNRPGRAMAGLIPRNAGHTTLLERLPCLPRRGTLPRDPYRQWRPIWRYARTGQTVIAGARQEQVAWDTYSRLEAGLEHDHLAAAERWPMCMPYMSRTANKQLRARMEALTGESPALEDRPTPVNISRITCSPNSTKWTKTRREIEDYLDSTVKDLAGISQRGAWKLSRSI